jgi:hypothetical protein
MITECTFAETRAQRVFHLTVNATSRRDSNPRITYITSISVTVRSASPTHSSKCFSNASDPPTCSPRPPPPPPTAPQYKPSTLTANPPERHHLSIRPANLSPSTAKLLHTSTSARANGIATTAPKPPPCMVCLPLPLPAIQQRPAG